MLPPTLSVAPAANKAVPVTVTVGEQLAKGGCVCPRNSSIALLTRVVVRLWSEDIGREVVLLVGSVPPMPIPPSVSKYARLDVAREIRS